VTAPDGHYAVGLDATEQELRAACGVLMDNCVANHARYVYATPGNRDGGRDTPLPTLGELVGNPATTILADCSRWIVCVCNILQAGMLEKVGGAYAASGTFYDVLEVIAPSACLVGDIGVIGTGGHIHAFFVRGPDWTPPTGPKGFYVSEDGAQGDPRTVSLSVQLAAHPGEPVTFLRLPVSPPV
jgi:hypothetical protein